MSKLMKYELLRRKPLLIGGALSMLFVEGLALLGIHLNGGWNALAIVMTVLLVVGGLILAFLDGVTRLYSDFKQKHGYMIFMTPQSGYKIIWAKTIFGVLEVLAAGLIITGCAALSVSAVDSLHNGIVSNFFAALGISTGMVVGAGFLGLFQLMAQLSIAFLAVTVSRSFMQSNSYSWLIALLMYFALALGVNVVDSVLLVAFGLVGDTLQIASDAALIGSGILGKYFVIGAVTYSVWFVACTVISGRLVRRGIDL